MDFDKVNEAPDPNEFKYRYSIKFDGKVSDYENKSRQYIFENKHIGFYYSKSFYIDNKGYVGVVYPIPNRTFVFKTNKGFWGKLQIQSYYKNAPIKPDPSSGKPKYLTFRYFIQKDGSRNLKTKTR